MELLRQSQVGFADCTQSGCLVYALPYSYGVFAHLQGAICAGAAHPT